MKKRIRMGKKRKKYLDSDSINLKIWSNKGLLKNSLTRKKPIKRKIKMEKTTLPRMKKMKMSMLMNSDFLCTLTSLCPQEKKKELTLFRYSIKKKILKKKMIT